MAQNMNDIRLVGIGLAVLYGMASGIFSTMARAEAFYIHGLALASGFGVLALMSAIAILEKEWTRYVLLVGNVLLGIYILWLNATFQHIVPLYYVVICIAAFLFFNQAHVKTRFIMTNTNDWKSILVIDDDETIIKTIRPILISNGFSVLTASTGEDGLQIARRQHPDLIILDVILPGIKGRDVCKQIKEDPGTKDIPVIFLTAKDSPDDIQAELSAGAERHLTKPVNARKLLEAIRETVAK